MSDSGDIGQRTSSYVVAIDSDGPGDLSSASHTDGSVHPQGNSTSSRKQLARSAFSSNDPSQSRAVHDNVAAEKHDSAGEYVKVMVFGGLDGIITTFAVVASIAGADLQTSVVLVMGFANLLADAVSMAFGEYISGDAEIRFVKHERKREAWEMDNYKDGELKEMVDLYVEKGFSREDATQIMDLMSKNKEFFVDHMLVEELGLLPPDEDNALWKQSAVMFASFVVFGLIPLLAYLIFSTFLDKSALFGISCALTAIALFGLGAFSARFSDSPWYRSGAFVFLNGASAAGVAYLVGYILTLIVEVDCA